MATAVLDPDRVAGRVHASLRADAAAGERDRSRRPRRRRGGEPLVRLHRVLGSLRHPRGGPHRRRQRGQRDGRRADAQVAHLLPGVGLVHGAAARPRPRTSAITRSGSTTCRRSSSAIFGHHDFVARLPGALLSAPVPLLLYGIAKEKWGRATGAVAAAAYVVVPIARRVLAVHEPRGLLHLRRRSSSSGGTRATWSTGKTRYLVASLVGLLFACSGDWAGYLLVAPAIVWSLRPGVRPAGAPRRRASASRPTRGGGGSRSGSSRARCSSGSPSSRTPTRSTRGSWRRCRAAAATGTKLQAVLDGAQGLDRLLVHAARDQARQDRRARVPPAPLRHAARRGGLLAEPPLRGGVPVHRLQGGRRHPHLLVDLLRAVLRPRARADGPHAGRCASGSSSGGSRPGLRTPVVAWVTLVAGVAPVPPHDARRRAVAVALAPHGGPLRRQRVADAEPPRPSRRPRAGRLAGHVPRHAHRRQRLDGVVLAAPVEVPGQRERRRPFRRRTTGGAASHPFWIGRGSGIMADGQRKVVSLGARPRLRRHLAGRPARARRAHRRLSGGGARAEPAGSGSSSRGPSLTARSARRPIRGSPGRLARTSTSPRPSRPAIRTRSTGCASRTTSPWRAAIMPPPSAWRPAILSRLDTLGDGPLRLARPHRRADDRRGRAAHRVLVRGDRQAPGRRMVLGRLEGRGARSLQPAPGPGGRAAHVVAHDDPDRNCGRRASSTGSRPWKITGSAASVTRDAG